MYIYLHIYTYTDTCMYIYIHICIYPENVHTPHDTNCPTCRVTRRIHPQKSRIYPQKEPSIFTKTYTPFPTCRASCQKIHLQKNTIYPQKEPYLSAHEDTHLFQLISPFAKGGYCDRGHAYNALENTCSVFGVRILRYSV